MKYFGTDNELEFVLTEKKEVTFEKHNHVSKYIAGLVLQGQVEIAIDQQTRECIKDDIYLIPVGKVHSICICSDETRVLSMCIGEKYMREHTYEEGKNLVADYVKKMITREVLQEEQANAFIEALEAFYCMLLVEDKSIQGPLNILKEQIIDRPERELSLEEMANQVFISKYYLLRQFKEKVGLTPHRFQIQNRIRKAKKLMQQGLSMTMVATEIGFYDQSHFIHYFQKFTGITPQEYLESIISLEEK